MCRTVYALMSTVICGIQMLVRVFMTFILMLENLFRMVLQTCYNFTSFMLQLISLVPICIVFILSSRLKCFMCGGGGPCPVNRGGTCDCLMSIIAMVIVFFIFRATGVLDKLFYSIGYAKAPKEVAKLALTTGELTECSRNESDTMVTQEEYEFYVYSSPEVPLECENLTDLDTYDLYGDGTLDGKGKGEKEGRGEKKGKGMKEEKRGKGKGTPKASKSKRTRKPKSSVKASTITPNKFAATTVNTPQNLTTRCGDPNASPCVIPRFWNYFTSCTHKDANGYCRECVDYYYPDVDDGICIMCAEKDVDTEKKCPRCPKDEVRASNGVCIKCGRLNEPVCSVRFPDWCGFTDYDGICLPCDPDRERAFDLIPDPKTGLICRAKPLRPGECRLCDSGRGCDRLSGKCVPCGEVNRPPCDPRKKPCKYPHREDYDTCLMCDDLTPNLHRHAEENICRICKKVKTNGDCEPCNGDWKLNEQGVCVAPSNRRLADNDDKQPDDVDSKVVTDDDGIIDKARYDDDDIGKASRYDDKVNNVSSEDDGLNTVKVGTNDDTINKPRYDDDGIGKDSHDDDDLNTIGNETVFGNNQTAMLYYLL